MICTTSFGHKIIGGRVLAFRRCSSKKILQQSVPVLLASAQGITIVVFSKVEFNMASNVNIVQSTVSGVLSQSSQPNSSSFENSCTGLVNEVPRESTLKQFTPSLKRNATSKPTYHDGGGISCCVPTCNSNSVRNKADKLSFYVIPKDPCSEEKVDTYDKT